uniref:Endoplasmic reticulum metallopeptidase 1 n=1 Tax=Sinocyclocheilus rhinocerous TaxID=307959 RepID=A0A673GXQ5_9TELE
MERDSTVRRIRAQQNQQKQPDCGDEAAALNGLRSRKHKPEVSAGLLGESSAVLLLLGFVCLLWLLVLLSLQQLIISSPGLFNALRARKHLERITSVGPRTVGSPENEIMTVNYLLDQIEQIRTESQTGPHSITVDVQRPTGSFSIDFLGGFTSYYDRVTNIAVKLEPKTTAQHFMLANCHFDSVANSLGASDDAVSCSVMLEVLHSLANLSTPLKHGIIFLFNGAEENILQASHGFITQHPWAQQVRAFVNLEAAGVGGKEVVFQTGPENPWLVQAYVRAAVHPFASVVGQEVFQSGVIPSDTDFRIYRDFGKIPGIDLAFIENGFIYHTKYDTPERIHTDSIQRAGGRYMRDLACAACVAVLSWFVALLTVLIVALLVTLAGRSMFWYSHFYAAVCLYGSAAVGKILLIHTLAKNLYYGGVSGVDLSERFFDVSLLLWCCALLFLTQRGLCSAYVPMMMVVFPLASKLLLTKHFRARGASLQYSVLYLTGLAVPYVHIMFLIWVVFEIFTPILGRSGTEIPPDVVLASLITLATVILSSYFMHFIYLTCSTRRILAGLGSVFVLMFVLVCCGLFFPYSADPSSPRPKRIFVQHSTRVLHALDGAVERSDSGLWINSLDYSGMQHITPHIPQINDSIRSRCSEQLPYCGFPWFLPVKSLVKKNWYLPAPEVSPEAPLQFRLLSRQDTEWGTVKMSFEAKGPSHMSLYLRPHAGASLMGWSFGDGTPRFDLSGEYFVFYSHGLDAPAWSFWLEIQVNVPPDEGLISLAVSSHYFFGPDRHSEQLESLLKRFPAWAFPSSWVSTYHMYRY